MPLLLTGIASIRRVGHRLGYRRLLDIERKHHEICSRLNVGPHTDRQLTHGDFALSATGDPRLLGPGGCAPRIPAFV